MKLFWFLIYLFLVITIIFAERKSPTEALLWVLILLCLPYVGIVLYLVFGSTMAIKITSYVRKKRLKQSIPELSAFHQNDIDFDMVSEEDAQAIRFNAIYNHSEITCCQESDIFTSGRSHYQKLFSDIENAKDCIYVEFYTIHHDAVGESFVQKLTAKAKEGVRVLVMCDFIANVSTPEHMFQPLKEAGGQVIRVKPFLTHYRSHRKIVVIDHRISYIGGMNIGKQYADMAAVKKPWRDTQIRLTGACCAVLDRYFLTDWLCSIKRRDWNQTIEYIHALPRRKASANGMLCQFIVGGVDTDKEAVKMCYLSLIRCAKKRIRIQTPYFIPDTSILDALKTASAAGVDIELMIPGIKASFFLDPVTTYYCGQLMEYGAKVYKYHGYIHAKTMMIDDEICCIGSVNMDMRSLIVDDEVCGLFYSDEMVNRYCAIYDEDIGHCTEYTYQEFMRRGSKEKVLESIFLLFAPLM